MAFVSMSQLDMIMLDREGRVLAASDVARPSTGLSRADFVGRRLVDLSGMGGGITQTLADDEAVLTPRSGRSGPTKMPNGDVEHFETDISPWRRDDGEVGGVICINRNITVEQRTQEALNQAEALLDAVVESIPSMISVRDVGNTYLRINGAGKAFYGVGSVRGPLQGALGPADPEAMERERQVAAAAAAYAAGAGPADLGGGEYELTDHAGRRRTVTVRRRVIVDRREVQHILTVADDITERKQAEAALRAALGEAEAANQAKSAFLATMSHEIRTPLNGVLGMAQAMAFDELGPVQRERLDVIRHSGEALLAILNDLLDISKIEAGRLELESIAFDLSEVVNSATASFSAMAATKGLALDVSLAGAEGTYRGDPTRLAQIIVNLVSNAIKFTSKGGVRVTAALEGGDLVVTVADSGPGIAADVLGRLFQKFVQADSSTTRRFGGTGLGLAICSELASLMGGRIWAESRDGQGAQFIVKLPLERLGDQSCRTEDRSEPEQAAEHLRILAAEDNPVNQKVLQTILEQVGLEVTLVPDGAQAVEAFAAHAWDVVLMDIQMPVMDGMDATRAIRDIERRENLPRTPIIALTANAMQHQVDQYLACGMDSLVAKPFQVAALLSAIIAQVDRPSALSSAA